MRKGRDEREKERSAHHQETTRGRRLESHEEKRRTEFGHNCPRPKRVSNVVSQYIHVCTSDL